MNDLAIKTENLTKIYGEQKAVKSVNLHVKKGRIYGLLGRNGILSCPISFISVLMCSAG